VYTVTAAGVDNARKLRSIANKSYRDQLVSEVKLAIRRKKNQKDATITYEPLERGCHLHVVLKDRDTTLLDLRLFTPDEETGRSADRFDVEKFGADFAYTIDGGELGGLEYENFNAANPVITFHGRSVHTGDAKGKMINAITLAAEWQQLLPAGEKPEYTEGYEGFFHIISFKGTVEEAETVYIIRDHDRTKFEEKKKFLSKCVKFINDKYGAGTAKATVKDQYYNMREMVEPHFFVVEKARKAIEMAGITPKVQPIRGGTDGANLSFRNLPCPNIFAGGLNFHGKMEFVPVKSMEKASEVILNIIGLYCQNK
jgi:tripeptide aminopeptidase